MLSTIDGDLELVKAILLRPLGVPLNALSSQKNVMIWPGSHSRNLSVTVVKAE